MITEHRCLPAAKAVIGHRHRNRHIHPDHADIHLADKIARGIAIAGEDRGAIAIFMVDHQLACLFIALRTQHRQHRTENLVTIDRHVRGHLVEQRAADEKPVLIALQPQTAAIHHDIGAILFALVDIAFDPCLGLGGDDRTHLDARLVILADFQCPHLWGQLFDKAVSRVITNRQHR